MITIHNSLSRSLEPFEPIDPNHVRMYVCGPTVYSTPHLGNARPAVVFDTLYRLLKLFYPRVSYARNLTDVDDKIIARAAEEGIAIEALTERTVQEYHEIVDTLGCLRPDAEPRATLSIPEMQIMIARLMEKGHAYLAEGHVMFDLTSYPEHGALSRHDVDALDHGHRVATASYKRSEGDFVLWKPAADEEPGWESPWGRGRPGWHIECSAMIAATFDGATLDIHGGGSDLRFPHHDCEISQSACAHDGQPLARYWMHNGMVLLDGRKVAKSTGNLVTVRDFLDAGHSGNAIRLGLLTAHYRQPLNLKEQIAEAKALLARWEPVCQSVTDDDPPEPSSNPIVKALCNDLNTPAALAEVHKLFGLYQAEPSPSSRSSCARFLRQGLQTFGMVFGCPSTERALTQAEAELLRARNEARARKDFAKADALRDELLRSGIVLKDTKGGTEINFF